mgnify:FL=1
MEEELKQLKNTDSEFTNFFGTGENMSKITLGGKPLLVWGVGEGFLKFRVDRGAAVTDTLRVRTTRLRSRQILYSRMADASTSGKNFRLQPETAEKISEDIPELSSFDGQLASMDDAGRLTVKTAFEKASERMKARADAIERAYPLLSTHIRNLPIGKLLSHAAELCSEGNGMEMPVVPETTFGGILKVCTDAVLGPVWSEIRNPSAQLHPLNGMDSEKAKTFKNLISEGLKSELDALTVLLDKIDETDISVTGAYLSMKNPEVIDCEGRNYPSSRTHMEGRHSPGHDGIVWKNLAAESCAVLLEPAAREQVVEYTILHGWRACLPVEDRIMLGEMKKGQDESFPPPGAKRFYSALKTAAAGQYGQTI